MDLADDDDGASTQRPARHIVLLLDPGSHTARAVCDMIAAGGLGADEDDHDDTRYRCTDAKHQVPVLLRRIPRLCETLAPEEEVAHILQQQKEAAASPGLKLVLTVEYAMIQIGAGAPSAAVFLPLVERAAVVLGAVGGVGRFGNALGLVCTVPLKDDGVRAEVKAKVVMFLRGMLHGLQGGSLGRHLESGWRSRCAAVVSCLVEGGEERVAVLRGPAGLGGPSGDEETVDVLRLLWLDTVWVQVAPGESGDVCRTLPLWVRPNIAHRVLSLQEAISVEASNAVAAAEAHVRALIQDAEPETEGPVLLRQLWDGGDGWWCGDVPAVRVAVDEAQRLLAELRHLQAVIEDDVLSSSEQLINENKRTVAELVRVWVLFLRLLAELGEYLWSYHVQCRRWAYDVRGVEDWGRGRGGTNERGLVVTADSVHLLFRLLDKKSGIKACAALAGVELDYLMLERLNRLLGEALRHEVDVTRRGNVVVVSGVCVVLSNVLPRILNELGASDQAPGEDRNPVVSELTSSAPSAPAAPGAARTEVVVLLGRDTVFIDREWNAGRLKVAVVAPRWYVVATGDDHLGQPAILLDGASAAPFEFPAARGRDACVQVEQESNDADVNLIPSKGGRCGHPGLAGGAGQAAGAFFGVAMDIVNSVNGHLLEVSACGGDGGDGQDGGTGGNGEDGQDATGAFLTEYKASRLGDVTSLVTLFYNQRTRKFYGSPGGKGGKGGDGGRGGMPGRAGEVVILFPRAPPEQGVQSVHLVALDGEAGAAGAGGKGGHGGRNGVDCTATLHFALFVPVRDVMTPAEGAAGCAAEGDDGEPGASPHRPGDAEAAEALDEEEKDDAMRAFVKAFSTTPPPRTLPRCRREASDQLLHHAERDWRLQQWYQQRAGPRANRRACSGSSFFTCTG